MLSGGRGRRAVEHAGAKLETKFAILNPTSFDGHPLPALTEGSEPSMATRSRCPFAFTLSTAQPCSSLKKVTRSINPDRLSCGRDGASVRNGSDCGCTVSGWQGALALA